MEERKKREKELIKSIKQSLMKKLKKKKPKKLKFKTAKQAEKYVRENFIAEDNISE